MKKAYLLLIIFFIYPLLLYPMDWKSLHNKADSVSLSAAQDNVAKNPGLLDNQYVLGLVYLNLHQDQAAYQIFSMLLSSTLISLK